MCVCVDVVYNLFIPRAQRLQRKYIEEADKDRVKEKEEKCSRPPSGVGRGPATLLDR